MNHDLYHLLPIDSKALPPPPPPTDTRYPQNDPKPFSHLDSMRLGLSVGIAFLAVFLVAILIQTLNGEILELLAVFFPGMDLSITSGIIVASLLAFVAGLIFGVVLAITYNALDNQRSHGAEYYG